MTFRLREIPTDSLTPAEVTAIRDVLWTAFPADDEAFTEADWEHSIGGMHFVLDSDSTGIVAHASVVEREIHIADRPLRTGYVEAVATAPDWQGQGYGTRVMTDVTAFVRATYELGALGTGAQGFYERFGWLTWRGPTSVRTNEARCERPTRTGTSSSFPRRPRRRST